MPLQRQRQRPRVKLEGSALADVLIGLNDRITRAEAANRDLQIEVAILRAELAEKTGVLPGTGFRAGTVYPRTLRPEDVDVRIVSEWLRR